MTPSPDSKQTVWETWFVLSFAIIIAYLLVGTMEDFQEMFPNWDIFACIAIFNFIFCLHIDLHSLQRKRKKKSYENI